MKPKNHFKGAGNDLPKFTDDEIIKALECCRTIDGNDCFTCPYHGKQYEIGSGGCTNDLVSDALALINLQKAEIERLKDKYECIYQPKAMIKAEAIKEFAERLVAIYENDKTYDRPNAHTLVVTVFRNIDNLVKEMTEGS